MNRYNSFLLMAISCTFLQILPGQTLGIYSPTQGFVAHEWGTFTTLRKSNGDLLSGLQKEEEPLPGFVQSLCDCFYYRTNKGWPYFGWNRDVSKKNITVKMETPVIYFYSADASEKNVDVRVNFDKGSISQWYPSRSGGESMITPTFNPNQTYYVPPEMTVDFSQPQNGWIIWQASILPSVDKSPYSNDPAFETATWVRPRATQSNLVKIKNADSHYDPQTGQSWKTNQVEKFLFYRGIGNFKEPLEVEFNVAGNLVITNNGEGLIDYAMVYEKKADGDVLIWWSGSLSQNRKKTVLRPASKSPIDSSAELLNFKNHLVSAGLYEDEASAMLKTWQESYFGHEGLKVFWIVPRKFTDEILAMQINPAPDDLQRVLIGRSEILTPEFEAQLNAMGPGKTDSIYSDDRFQLAYYELLQDGTPSTWTDYNVLDQTTALTLQNLASTDFEVFPNPVTGALTVQLPGAGKVRLFGSNGSLVRILQNAVAGENKIDMADLEAGIYFLKVELENGTNLSKKIVKSE